MASTTSFGDANYGLQAGNINGSVNAEFHLPPGTFGNATVRRRSEAAGTNNSPTLERPETPPTPSAIIPFARDTDFVERAIFDQIETKCAAPGSRTALVGLGGVG
jgi:hypothetical protein